MRVLITGVDGLVGRHMAMRYLEMHHEVVGIDNHIPGGGAVHPDKWEIGSPLDSANYTQMLGDCRDLFAKNYECDLILHFAAVVGGRQTIEDMPLSVADDLSIDSAMWQWAARVKPRVAYFSSSAAYPVDLQGLAHKWVLEERDINLRGMSIGIPDMSYGWAKLTGEYLGMLAAERAGVSHVVYRPFSGYAEDQGTEYPMRAICNRAIDTVLGGMSSTYVWGDGQQVRDWVHIEDIVSIVEKTVMTVRDGTVLNLSTGHGTSMTDLMQLAIEVAQERLGRSHTPVDVLPMSDKPSGVMHRVGCPNRRRALVDDKMISVVGGVNCMIREELLRR